MHLCTHADMNAGDCQVQKKMSGPQKLKLQVVVRHLTWVPGAEAGAEAGPLQEQSLF